MRKQVHKLGFYATPEHPCSYLPGRQATTLFADPGYPMSREVYTQLAASGFRRSGEFLYQPWCNSCQACVPVRIPVREFSMRRNQKRIWQRNQDLQFSVKPMEFNPSHFELYCRYIAARHAGGGMDNPAPRDYLGFLHSNWMDTAFHEFRLEKTVLAVAVVDQLEDALSAVYTFYDPDHARRSLGTFAILYQIMEAQRQGLDWVYLGYWIRECEKMSYKNQFRPAEYMHNRQWQRTPPA